MMEEKTHQLGVGRKRSYVFQPGNGVTIFVW
jgi:hypothetical protein